MVSQSQGIYGYIYPRGSWRTFDSKGFYRLGASNFFISITNRQSSVRVRLWPENNCRRAARRGPKKALYCGEFCFVRWRGLTVIHVDRDHTIVVRCEALAEGSHRLSKRVEGKLSRI